MGITDGTVRVSVGIEDPYDIVADIDRALATIQPGERALGGVA